MAAILDMQISWFSNFEPSEGVQKKIAKIGWIFATGERSRFTPINMLNKYYKIQNGY